MPRSQLPAISGRGTGASAREKRETVKIGDVVIECTYELQNDILRALDIFGVPFVLDPREAYSGIEDCKFK